MSKLNMTQVQIFAPKVQRKGILELLQKMSVLDISVPAEQLPEGFFRENKSKEAETFRRNAVAAEKALDTINRISPEKKSLLSSFSGRRIVTEDEFFKARDSEIEIMKVCYKVETLEREIAEAKVEIVRLSTGIEQMQPWINLDVPLSYSGTSSTVAFIGSVSGNYTLETLLEALATKQPQLKPYLEVIGNQSGQTLIFLTCAKKDKELAEDALRKLGFARPAQNTSKLPIEKIRSRRERIDALKEKIAKNTEEIASFSDFRQKIELVSDYFLTRAEKYETIGLLDETEHTIMISGYLPECDYEVLEDKLEEKFTVVIERETPDEDLAPVKLKNNSFSGPAETITSMYALPSSKDIDPTPITSFFYYFFFGMMLSDAGYGILMWIATWAVNRFLKPEPNMRKNMKLFMYCGISTTFWGFFFGSFFGIDIISIIYSAVTSGGTLPFKYPFINPLEGDALAMLILSVALGLLQIIAGMCAKFYITMKDENFISAFLDTGLWITTLLGFAILAAGMFAFPILKTAGAVMAVGSLVGIVIFGGRKKKGVMKVLGGVASLYDITSYVSDLLSFSRLMALGLTTAAMSMVFNKLGMMVSQGLLGKIFMVAILLIGHAVNFGLNALGAYVHTLRLQYVELFSKFYEGGGREYKPFAHKSKYTRIKEDK